MLLDSGFHWGIFRASRSDLVSIARSYWGRHLRELGQRVDGDTPLAPFADQHDRILAALAGRDEAAARAVAAEHIESGRRAAERSYEQDEAGAGAAGGGSARPGRCWVEQADGTVADHTGDVEFAVRAGDVVGFDTPGGGGYG